jgi:hypothetical protein
MTRRIEARTPHGIGLGYQNTMGGQMVVCFTEMPIAELSRMASRGRNYGIAFPLEALRGRGAQPVWYVSDPSPQLSASRQLMSSSTNPADPIWKLTPFTDIARLGSTTSAPHDWRWEREWRVVGDLEFEIEDIAAVIIPTPDGNFEPVAEISFGAPYVTHDGDFYWVDGLTPATDAAMSLLYDKFHGEWVTPDDAMLPYDNEAEWGYAEIVPIEETQDAVDWSFDHLPWQIQEALATGLSRESNLWCRADLLAQVAE